jgi:hypothetical protein
MASSDSQGLSDDSRAGNDPRQSRAVPNSRSHGEDEYATDPDSIALGTPQKNFDEEDGQSDGSEFHTSAQPSKPRRLPKVRGVIPLNLIQMQILLILNPI